MSVSRINREIYQLSSLDDVRAVMAACRARFSDLQSAARVSFYTGQKVKFADRRRGVIVEATVTKINQKTIKVKATSGVIWTVSPSLLQAA